LLLGYASFYNALNLFRSLRQDHSPLRPKRIVYQFAGCLAVMWTICVVIPYLLRLLFRRPEYHKGALPQSTLPVRRPGGSFSRLPENVIPHVPEPHLHDRQAA
jgi:hypothetical protein